jgi:hypothetical protein
MPLYRVYMTEKYFRPVQVEAENAAAAKTEVARLIELEKWPSTFRLPQAVFAEREPMENWSVEPMRNIEA